MMTEWSGEVWEVELVLNTERDNWKMSNRWSGDQAGEGELEATPDIVRREEIKSFIVTKR